MVDVHDQFGSITVSSPNLPFKGGQARRKILSILDSIDFAQDSPAAMQLDFFNPGLTEQVVASCEQKNDLGVTFANVRLLHRILTNELHGSLGSSTGQRPHIQQVIYHYH